MLGLGQKTASLLIEVGVSGIDVAGANGTSWAWIDAMRKTGGNISEWFKDFGISTQDSLINVSSALEQTKKEVVMIASGGLRNPIQGLKSRSQGADLYSAAYPFLEPALENSPEKLIELIAEWQKGLKIAMFCTGMKNW